VARALSAVEAKVDSITAEQSLAQHSFAEKGKVNRSLESLENQLEAVAHEQHNSKALRANLDEINCSLTALEPKVANIASRQDEDQTSINQALTGSSKAANDFVSLEKRIHAEGQLAERALSENSRVARALSAVEAKINSMTAEQALTQQAFAEKGKINRSLQSFEYQLEAVVREQQTSKTVRASLDEVLCNLASLEPKVASIMLRQEEDQTSINQALTRTAKATSEIASLEQHLHTEGRIAERALSETSRVANGLVTLERCDEARTADVTRFEARMSRELSGVRRSANSTTFLEDQLATVGQRVEESLAASDNVAGNVMTFETSLEAQSAEVVRLERYMGQEMSDALHHATSATTTVSATEAFAQKVSMDSRALGLALRAQMDNCNKTIQELQQEMQGSNVKLQDRLGPQAAAMYPHQTAGSSASIQSTEQLRIELRMFRSQAQQEIGEVGQQAQRAEAAAQDLISRESERTDRLTRRAEELTMRLRNEEVEVADCLRERNDGAVQQLFQELAAHERRIDNAIGTLRQEVT